jgi:hypothetical protein
VKVGDLLVKIGADTGDLKRGVKQAKREIASLPDEHTININVNKRSFRDLRYLREIVLGISIAAPLAAAGLESAAGAAAGLASALGTATAGTIGFGAVAVAVLNDVFDAQKKIEKAQQDYAKALTADEQQTALENLQQAYMGLNEGQLVALASLQKFRSFWDGFSNSFQAPVILTFAAALEGLQYFLENLGPTIKNAGTAILGVFNKMNDAMKNADFQRFFQWLETSVGPAITSFGDVAINVFQGFLNLLVAFQPLSDAMQGGLKGISQAFLQWTQNLGKSQEFKDFLSYVIAVGPQVWTFFKLATKFVMDFFGTLARAGQIILPFVNVVLALLNSFIGIGKGAEHTRARIDDLKNSIKSLLGVSTVGAESATGATTDLDKAYQDIIDSVGGIGAESKSAGKNVQKFIAAFDEVYQVPDTLDAIDSKLPTTTPSTPTTPQPNPDQVFEYPQQQGKSWIDKFLDELKKIPPAIDFPKINPPDPADGGASGVTTGVNGVVAAVNAVSPAWGAMLEAVTAANSENIPLIVTELGKVSLALAFPTISTAISWATMWVSMSAKVAEVKPSIMEGIQEIKVKLQELTAQGETTESAWTTMLNNMQVAVNAYQPYISWGLVLIALDMANIVPVSVETSTGFAAMLDAMQVAVNAYQPYISWGLFLMVQSLWQLQTEQANTAESTETSFSSIYDSIAKWVDKAIPKLNKLISKLKEAKLLSGEKLPNTSTITDYGDVGPVWEQTPMVGPTWEKSAETKARELPVVGEIYQALDVLANVTKPLSEFAQDYLVPGAGIGAAAGAAEMGAANLTSKLASMVSSMSAKGAAESVIKNELSKVLQTILSRRNSPERVREALDNVSGFAGGGIIGRDSIIRAGEGNKREAIIPLENDAAMAPFAAAVADRLGGSMGGSSGGREVYIGVVDTASLKALERQLKIIRVNEDQRGANR